MSDSPHAPSAIPPVEFDLTIQDGQGIVDHHFSTPEGRRSLEFKVWREVFVALILTIMFALVFTAIPTWVRGWNDPTVWATTAAGFGLALVLTLVAHWPGRARSKARNELLLKVQKQWVPGPRRIELTEEGVFTTSPIFRGTHFWQAIRSVERATAGVHMNTADQRSLSVPIRAFSSAAAADEFAATARRMMELSKPKHPPVVHAPRVHNP